MNGMRHTGLGPLKALTAGGVSSASFENARLHILICYVNEITIEKIIQETVRITLVGETVNAAVEEKKSVCCLCNYRPAIIIQNSAAVEASCRYRRGLDVDWDGSPIAVGKN